jgi:vacuolar-type H+-ATPase subunit H
MAESRRDTARTQRQGERTAERGIDEAERTTERGVQEAVKATERGIEEAERAAERGLEALKEQTERVEETGRDAARRASETSARAFSGAARTGLALTDATEEIVSVWMHYAGDVMRNTSQAGEALLRSRSIPEVMQVQVGLLHDNLQSFLDHSAKLADTASRMATRPFEVAREESTDQALR